MAQFTQNSTLPPSYGSIITDSSKKSPENLLDRNPTENFPENLPENLNENLPGNSRINSLDNSTNHFIRKARENYTENSSITINVISGDTWESDKEWKTKNLSSKGQPAEYIRARCNRL